VKGILVKSKYYVKVRPVQSFSCFQKLKCHPLKLKFQIGTDEEDNEYENEKWFLRDNKNHIAN